MHYGHQREQKTTKNNPEGLQKIKDKNIPPKINKPFVNYGLCMISSKRTTFSLLSCTHFAQTHCLSRGCHWQPPMFKTFCPWLPSLDPDVSALDRQRNRKPEEARVSYGPSHEICVILFWFEPSGRVTTENRLLFLHLSSLPASERTNTQIHRAYF